MLAIVGNSIVAGLGFGFRFWVRGRFCVSQSGGKTVVQHVLFGLKALKPKPYVNPKP